MQDAPLDANGSIEQLHSSNEYEPNEAELERQAAFDTLDGSVSFAGDAEDNPEDNPENNPDAYAESRLDGHDEQGDASFGAEDTPDKIVVDEDEMNERNFTDERLDDTKETLENTLDYENANYGRATVTASLHALSSLATRITDTGVINPEVDNDSDQSKIETQSNNLCKATAIYALNASQLADTAIIRHLARLDVDSAKADLEEVSQYVVLTEQAAALAKDQLRYIESPRLEKHVLNRLEQATTMATLAEQRLKEAIETAQAKLQENPDAVEDLKMAAQSDEQEPKPDEANEPRCISSIGARIDKFMEESEKEPEADETTEDADDAQDSKVDASDESEFTPDLEFKPKPIPGIDESSAPETSAPATSKIDDDGYEGLLSINQPAPERDKIVKTADDIISNPDYYSTEQGGEGEAA